MRASSDVCGCRVRTAHYFTRRVQQLQLDVKIGTARCDWKCLPCWLFHPIRDQRNIHRELAHICEDPEDVDVGGVADEAASDCTAAHMCRGDSCIAVVVGDIGEVA